MKKLNWGILGCADIAENRLVPALVNETDNGVLYALASRGGARFERMKERYHPQRTYLDYDALLRDPAVDAVYIPVPNGLHKEWIIRAARAGKHILCEKPLVCTQQELDEAEAACRENGVILIEAFACMHSPLFDSMKAVIASGEIGEVKSVYSAFCYPLDDGPSVVWDKALEGGALYDIGCYCTQTIRTLTGREPVSARAVGRFGPTGVDVCCYGAFDLGDGVYGLLETSLDSAFKRVTEVKGTRGCIRFDRTPNAWGDVSYEVPTKDERRTVTLSYKSSYALELEQMGRCVLEGETPRYTLRESRANIRALEMLFDEIRR